MGYRSAATNCIVRGLSSQQKAVCRFVREEAGRCWTDMLCAHIQSRGGKWLSSVDLGKMYKGQYQLHSQSIQALAQKLEANVETASQLRKTEPEARYPYRPRHYQTVTWKESAIHWTKDGKLLLSNGQNTPALVLRVPGEYLDADLCRVELTWRADHYELCLTMDTGLVNPPRSGRDQYWRGLYGGWRYPGGQRSCPAICQAAAQ